MWAVVHIRLLFCFGRMWKLFFGQTFGFGHFLSSYSALAEGDSATVYIYIILGVACTGQYITCQSSPAAIKYFYGRMCAQRGGYTMIPTCCKKTRAKYIVAGAAVVNCMPYRGPPLMQDDTLIFWCRLITACIHHQRENFPLLNRLRKSICLLPRLL